MVVPEKHKDNIIYLAHMLKDNQDMMACIEYICGLNSIASNEFEGAKLVGKLEVINKFKAIACLDLKDFDNN